MKRKILFLLVTALPVVAGAQTVAVQRVAHNSSVCASLELSTDCTVADVVLKVCGFSSGPSGVPQSQIDACSAGRPHAQKLYAADAAFRAADDQENQKTRIEREKQAIAGRVQRQAVAVIRAGGANCVSLLNLLGQADTSVCSR